MTKANSDANTRVEDSDRAYPLIWDDCIKRIPTIHKASEFDVGEVKGIFFDGIPYKGKDTKVFAYIGIPNHNGQKNKNKTGKIPGMVLIHGGGGTACHKWVKIWNDQGYAAIAMDTEGNVPPLNKTNTIGKEPEKNTYWSGPPRDGIFDDVDLPYDEQWVYHAVADIILANSLLCSIEDVDSKRVGVTGISWGGVLTGIVSGIDSRFALGISVYGCGYLYESLGCFGLAYKNPKKRYWDPARFIKDAKMPMLWVSSDHDFAFSINIISKSRRINKNSSTLVIHPDMKHSHQDGWKPKEMYAFANSLMKGKKSLATIQEILINKSEQTEAILKFSSENRIKEVEIIYCLTELEYDTKTWELKSTWLKEKKSIKDYSLIESVSHDESILFNTIKVNIPKGTRYYYVNIIDEFDLVVSSDLVKL